MQDRPHQEALKHPFSLVEILICLTLIVSFGALFVSRGSHFLQARRLQEETKILCHILNRGALWAHLEQKPLDIYFTPYKEGVRLQIPELKIVKTLDKVSFLKKVSFITLYPNMTPSQELELKGVGRVYFDPKTSRFLTSKV